jgi:LysR family transcriptional regulator, glycine cleavage system transcriptional activator
VSAGAARLPSLDGLQAVEAAARLGTFERAAEELAVTASAVSKRVAAVEELVGVPLFVRGARSLVLTDAGREYLQPVRHALGLLAAMPQHQRDAPALQRLRVSTPPTFARLVLMPALEAFTREHPQVELELVLSIPHLDLATAAAASDADVQVRFGPATLGEPLLHDRVLPLLAPSLLATLQRQGPLQGAADLARAPLLRTPLEPWTPWFRAAGLPWPEPAAGPRFVDLGLTLEAALAGQGVALGRPTLARHWLATGALVAPWPLFAEPANRYVLLPHATAGAAGAFAHWLRDTCARVEAEAAAVAPAGNSGAG